jgi:hypothetical protein
MGQRRFGVLTSRRARPKAALVALDEKNFSVAHMPKERINKNA